jgi:pyruvate/2-oxoglutarate dehydrogenase complex dihydrolipoamide dehydrogenase (E3) component
VAVVPYAALDRAVIDGHRKGFCKLIVSTEKHRILGAHIMGEQALEIPQLLATCLAAESVNYLFKIIIQNEVQHDNMV